MFGHWQNSPRKALSVEDRVMSLLFSVLSTHDSVQFSLRLFTLSHPLHRLHRLSPSIAIPRLLAIYSHAIRMPAWLSARWPARRKSADKRRDHDAVWAVYDANASAGKTPGTSL